VFKKPKSCQLSAIRQSTYLVEKKLATFFGEIQNNEENEIRNKLLVIPAMYLIVAAGIDFPVALAGLGAVILLSGLLIAVRFITGHTG
jgi:hypothetical protein